jgi:hypothetical protein
VTLVGAWSHAAAGNVLVMVSVALLLAALGVAVYRPLLQMPGGQRSKVPSTMGLGPVPARGRGS